MTAEPLFLGIDGGGSKCRARLCDGAGRALGEGEAGAANVALGLDITFGEIRKAAERALEDAGLSDVPLSDLHAGAGLAGMPLRREREELRRHPHPFASFEVDTDAYTACLGAHGGADGAILIVGTGTCGVIIADAEATYVGGWGLVIGDEGSGAYLGRAAVRRALREHDGILPRSRIGDAIMGEFESRAEQLVTWAATARPGDYGKFVPDIIDHAQAGDAVARGLLHETGEDVCLLVEALLAKGAPDVALVGGLAGPIRPWLPERIRPLLVEPKGDPLDGALMLARRRFHGAEAP
ncbi:MAG: N-acetylglucosamine kinase [Proteobacteria bacterium]|nr:N-acetylglucosamine kinase [Pseudomonadota bacterium]